VILTPLILAATLAVAPTSVPDPPDPYAWICDSLDSAPTLFGVMAVAAEVVEQEDDPATTKQIIIDAVNSGCPNHAPLLSNLTLVVGG
jgi:hypothetical protein